MPSIFTKIIQGEIPCHKIAENDNFFAFLDIMPLSSGHTLVVPKREIDYLFNLPDDLLGEMHVFAKPIAIAMQKAIPCKRIGTAVIGLEVPHAHLHLIPINGVSDINFERPKMQVSQEELRITAEKIKDAYQTH